MSEAVSGIETIPEGVTNISAAVNQAITTIGALMCPPIISRSLTAPPGSPSDGDCYIPDSVATGAWAGKEGHIARYVLEGNFWMFYEPGSKARIAIDLDQSPPALIYYDGSAWLSLTGS
jgi:hypothetical protein